VNRLLAFVVCNAVFWLVLGNAVGEDRGVTSDVPLNQVFMEVFVRGDLQSAQNVENYIADLRSRTPGLSVVVHDVVKDRQQLSRLYDLSKKAGRDKPSIPAFHCCDRVYFGFASAAESGPQIEELFTADVYTRATCPRCRNAKAFIAELQLRWPAIRFRIHEVDGDAVARARWEALCRAGGSVPGLPTIDFARHVIIGYQGDEVTGKQIEELIRLRNRSAAPSAQEPKPAPLRFFGGPPELELPDEASESETGTADVGVAEGPEVEAMDGIEVPWFGKLRVAELGLPLFTFAIGLIDGFNPCAMWILVFLLSVLVNIKDRRKILLIAGTFVVVSGVAYFAFMAAWLNLFMLIGIARPLQIALGIVAVFIGVVNVKDFFAFKKGISFSIPESQKPGLYRRVRKIVEAKYLGAAIGGVVALAIIVNLVELLCTAGLPALYTQILTLQELPVWQNYAYLALYILAYMIDDTVLLSIVVATLSHRKLQEREGRWLKLISGMVVLVLGTVMIFFPSWLA
jgi:Glutaredoxin